ncbi:ABC transporter permease [Zavarzinella formosa]|uniref:ABC transporter permease n=1 Tax=Zavarzinella formosa TaxID=360055 RepID=UPI0002E5ED7D|nr:ABC transporter permease [Zavarzinella formosa]
MTTPLLNVILASLILVVLQVIVAIPWLVAFDGRPFKKWATDATVLSYLAGGTVVGAVVLGWYLRQVGELTELERYGRYFGALFHLQLILDFIILAPRAILLVWPKGGAVAISALRESLRQPMFWLIFALATLLIIVSTFIPYFTLGDDYKLMKQVGFDAVMLFSALFGLLTASISVNEEIEGRTAITVISKPVSRRQFFIGKYLGILLACWAMTMLLGWVLTWALHFKPRFDPLDDAIDPMPMEVAKWMAPKVDWLVPTTEGSAFARGMGTWLGETTAHHIGLFRVFGQVMIMLAICTALATRVQFIVNLVICLGIFLVGNLSPIMVHVTQKPENEGNPALQLVSFIAQLFNAVFPALDSFDMGPAIIRDTPLATSSFIGFVTMVMTYTVLYTAVAILSGLLLFEDRDLA